MKDLKVGDRIYTVKYKRNSYAKIIGETKTQFRCEHEGGGKFNITKDAGMKVGTANMFCATFYRKVEEE